MSEEAAEYKQVTVLFADVVRSMEIAATLGAERLREIMTDLLDLCAAVVQRYGGTLDKFTGDGVMALFGAPIALEDHAFRACLAALEIQGETRRLAAEVETRDRITLALRVGLNSGEVIAGEMSSHPMGYTAIGEQVGLAQRMESVAPPGGVMASESTARLVDERVVLGSPEMVRIKGVDAPVPARRVHGIAPDSRAVDRRECSLIGRAWERNAIVERLDRSLRGAGVVVGFVGSPGIGKSRLTRETVALATSRGFDVFSTYCESHTREIPFHVVARLLRMVFGVAAASAEVARSRVRAQLPGADSEDLLLLDDLLGIRHTATPLPDISPDARRRRLTALVNTAALVRRTPTVYVIEDAHWIDDVSDSMLFEFASVVRQTHSMVVVTYRPEYRGLLSGGAGAEVLELEPLDDVQCVELTSELLGTDRSVAGIVATIAERAAGNPFFTEEIVRDLAERGVLRGERGYYVCVGDVVDVSVPATLQATIGARIDRLSPVAKRTLHAAAVIGARFDAELLAGLFDQADLSPLIEAELVEPMLTTPRSEYAFRHPLIQKVAYESQLKSTRSALHRRLANAIEQDPALGDENAAFIAIHWEAAGDLRAAFNWHMRAGSWFNYRDVRAARTSWLRAQQVADRMAVDEPDRSPMRISPRTLLCGSAFRVGVGPADTGFEELRDLADAARDDVSLAIGMAGQLTTLAFHSHYREAVKMAAELEVIVDSVGDPTLTIALLYAAAQAKWEAGAATECRRLVQRVIDLADGDPTRGNVMLASPLAWVLSLRGAAGLALGRRDWNTDVEHGIALAEPFDATARVVPMLYRYAVGMTNGALLPDDSAAVHTAAILKVAEQSGDDTAVALARLNRAVVLARIDRPESHRVLEMLAVARGALAQTSGALRRIADVEFARETARQGDVEGAVVLARIVLDEYCAAGDMIARGPATALLVELLLRRRDNGDLETVKAEVDRLAALPTEPGFVLHEPQLLRLSALLARAHNQHNTYRDYVERYRKIAKSRRLEGHTAIANSM